MWPCIDLKQTYLTGRILAPFDYGSFLAYKLYPDNLIYMDGRYEEVYFNQTKDLLDDFYNVKNDGYKILNDKPEYVIVPTDALVNDYMQKIDDYKLIYNDETDCLYSYITNMKSEYKHLNINSENLKEYIKSYSALKPNFQFTDNIVINGEKVIFK